MTPLVSVLVPVYGVEKYIACCARSLFGQTYADIEYIFVDDCTPDGSIGVLRSVLEEFPQRKSQVRIIRQDCNRGVGAARQRALDECTGSYVIHADSDDRMAENAVEKLVEAAVRTDADIVDGAYCEFPTGTDGIFRPVVPVFTDRRRYLRLMLLQNIVKNNLWGRIYRRSLYTDHDIRLAEGIDYAEDFSILPRLFFFATRSCIDDVVYFYRNDNAQSYTHRQTPRQNRSMIDANATVYRFFLRYDDEGVFRPHLCMGMINLYRYARRNGLPQSEVDTALGTPIAGFAPRLCRMLFGSRLPYTLADFVYRLLRRMYI